MPWFGQDIFIKAQDKGGLDSDEYRQALELVQGFTRSAYGYEQATHHGTTLAGKDPWGP